PWHRDRRAPRSGARPRALDRRAAPGCRAADPDLGTRAPAGHSPGPDGEPALDRPLAPIGRPAESHPRAGRRGSARLVHSVDRPRPAGPRRAPRARGCNRDRRGGRPRARARLWARVPRSRARPHRGIPAGLRRRTHARPDVSEGFRFFTSAPLESPAGQVASDLESLKAGIATVSPESIFQHVTRMPVRFPHARDLPENDFARWVGDALQLPEVSERLAFAGTLPAGSLEEVRAALLAVLDRVPERD